MNMDYYFNPIYSIIIIIYNQYYYNTIHHIHIESITPLPHRCLVDPVRVGLSRWLVWSRWSALYILYIRYDTIDYIRLTIDHFPSLLSLLPIR